MTKEFHFCPWCGTQLINLPETSEKEPMIIKAKIECVGCQSSIIFREHELGFTINISIATGLKKND